MSRFFQNRETIIPYAQVTHVMKHPPDRIQVGLVGGTMIDLIGVEDCGQFIKGYASFLGGGQ